MYFDRESFDSQYSDSVPLTERFPETREATQFRRREVTAKRILAVEPEPSTQEQLTQVLASIDPALPIDWVPTAEEAEELLEEHPERYALVLSGLLLPGEMSGVDLWEYCEESHPEIPFVIVSGIGPRQFLEWIGPHRVTPIYLQKPFYAAECREVLADALGETRELEEVE